MALTSDALPCTSNSTMNESPNHAMELTQHFIATRENMRVLIFKVLGS